MPDPVMHQGGIDPYIFWLLGQGKPYYFLPDRQPEGQEWMPVLLRLREGLTARDFGEGLHITSREKRAAWQDAVQVPELYTESQIGADEGPYITALMNAGWITKDFIGDEELRADLRRAVESITPGLTLDRDSLPPPGRRTKPQQQYSAPQEEAAPAPANTVVMGIIDDGIAFAHERFRKIVDGATQTRIENWWLQDGPFDSAGSVPFGKELTSSQINALLTNSTIAGDVEEELLYRQAGLIDFKQPGHKSAAWRVAHGTHVMDLACGFDPSPPRHDRPIIAVQLPIRVTADTAGASLFSHVAVGILYILDRARQIPGAANAPVVVNVSYGRLEGPHDGTADLELAIELLVALSGGRLRVVLPAGNSYLSRTHAQVAFTADNEEKELHWRVLPDDRTPSFMELWLPARASLTAASRLAVTITSPTGERHTIGEGDAVVRWGAAPFYAEAAFYFSLVTGRTMFRLSARPTTDLTPGAPLAPPGTWKIKLKNGGLTGRTVHAWVQRDDQLYGFPLRGRQSFFEDTHYVRFDDAGRDKETDDLGVMVRRESTLSSIATGASPYVAGGHLGKELVAARYSSAGASEASGGPPPRWPDAMTPSEDSRVHHGVLAAGARSGSVVPLGGTSVAAPQMARWIADHMPATHATVSGAAIPMTAATPPERKGAGRLPVTPLVKLKRYEFP